MKRSFFQLAANRLAIIASLFCVWATCSVSTCCLAADATADSAESVDVETPAPATPITPNTIDQHGDVPQAKLEPPSPSPQSPPPTSDSETADEEAANVEPPPFDYDPYRVLIWVASDSPRINAASFREETLGYLNRDFFSIWRTTILDAPPAVTTAAQRGLSEISFDVIAASDPVIAVKRDHPDTIRIRFAADVGRYIKKIIGTKGRVQDMISRVAADPTSPDNPKFGWVKKLEAAEGDAVDVGKKWSDPETEAILMSRGMAETLDEPKAKLIIPPVDGQVVQATEQFDKIYVVRIETNSAPISVQAIEFDTLMRYFGSMSEATISVESRIGEAIGEVVRSAFSPVARIDDAGQKSAIGLVRAAGLALDPDSPAHIHVGDVLEPMVRKDDRNGNPISIGALDWAYLHVVENEMAGFGVRSVKGIKLGDQITSVAGTPVKNPHAVERIVRIAPKGPIPVEVLRGGKPQKLQIRRGESPVLQPQYFGFLGREKTIAGKKQLTVSTVLKDSPADGNLMSDDVILAVGKTKDPSLASLSQLVVSTKPDQPVEFTVQRGEATQTVSIVPSHICTRRQLQASTIDMDFYAGRAGGLQGRKNNRTFRMAVKVVPRFKNTQLRLHAKGKPNDPLIGYEIYDKELDSSSMEFVGRTDWNGRLLVGKIDRPLRLLYVKNGGAVLARLPIVPGHNTNAVADLAGDDMRLQAESYIRGVQNSIIDLVAVRELFKARIRLRLRKGDVKEAEALLEALRTAPSNEKLANEMGKRQAMFLKAIGRNPNQQRKVDEMFSITRELLSKHINPKLVRDLEDDFITAKENGGKLPEEAK